jgi:hypothetical protein
MNKYQREVLIKWVPVLIGIGVAVPLFRTYQGTMATVAIFVLGVCLVLGSRWLIVKILRVVVPHDE